MLPVGPNDDPILADSSQGLHDCTDILPSLSIVFDSKKLSDLLVDPCWKGEVGVRYSGKSLGGLIPHSDVSKSRSGACVCTGRRRWIETSRRQLLLLAPEVKA